MTDISSRGEKRTCKLRRISMMLFGTTTTKLGEACPGTDGEVTADEPRNGAGWLYGRKGCVVTSPGLDVVGPGELACDP